MSKSLQERLNSLERKYRSLCCKANSETPSAPAYKVYTALLTQSGGDGALTTISGTLTIGVTYKLGTIQGNDDFTNVGAPTNEFGVLFVATGTTPANWGSGTELEYNTGAPVVIVLENTIGNIWFTYGNVGIYKIASSGLFLDNKTTAILSPTTFTESPLDIHSSEIMWFNGSQDEMYIRTFFNYEPADDQLNYGGAAMIEIRVYN